MQNPILALSGAAGALILLVTGCASEVTMGAPRPGAAADDGSNVIRLPGDRDDAPPGPRGDAWDYRNDPRRLAQNLNYVIEELPASGQSDHDVWAASYWPTYQGSTNHRWRGSDMLSPTELYDAAFHEWRVPEAYADLSDLATCGAEANTEYSAYREALGPAARWQAGSQGRTKMYDGRDNDDDQEIDECGDHDGVESWWGLCHAWSPASILEPEPQHSVEYNGQTFEVSDIKALLLTAYDDTRSRMLGGRCNDREVDHDDSGRITADECRDVNAGAWHVIVTNFLGLNGQPLIEDRTGGYQVWNQPLIGYEVTYQGDIALADALALLEQGEGDEYPFNDQADRFVEVRMRTSWVTESHPSTEPVGHAAHTRSDQYHYVLEIDDRNKVIGGEWVGTSRERHPDFLWVPIEANTSSYRRSNPHVELEKVRTLLALSLEEPGGGVGEGKTYTNETVIDIPDNSLTGAASVITVEDDNPVDGISVSVDISHTWRGDLRAVLSHDGVEVVLHDRAGGSADDLRETWTLSDFAGTSSHGEWVLHVSDHATRDTGTIRRLSITMLGAATADELVFEAPSAPLVIPDNDQTGVVATIDVDDEATIGTLAIDVDVAHTYRGDLVVELTRGEERIVLHDRQGGAADDLIESYEIDVFAGTSIAGRWELRVADHAARDVGTLRAFRLRVVPAEGS